MNPELDFEKRYRLVREIIETVALTLLMFIIIRFAVQNYFVDGVSMEPNLHNQERILVDKWTYLFHAPGRGDVIVFVAPPDPAQDYVKRIIGIPGDTITINDTTVIVDGVTLHEPYIDPRRQGNPYDYKQIQNMIVPSNAYFVLGDNRAGSSDSRDWGFVPRENIIGRAALVYWPFGEDNYGLLPNESIVFAQVHQACANSCSEQQGNRKGPSTTFHHPLPLPWSQSGGVDMMLLVILPGALAAYVRRRKAGATESECRRAGPFPGSRAERRGWGA